MFQEDSESRLWQRASWNSISRPTEFPLTLASSEQCLRIFVPFHWEAGLGEGGAENWEQRAAGRELASLLPATPPSPSLIHFAPLRFPSLSIARTLFSSFTFAFLLSPREYKLREAGRWPGLRARGARSASKGRVGSCPYISDVLFTTFFFALILKT